MSWASTLGSLLLGDGRCRFRVWAPRAKRVEVEVVEPRERRLRLEPEGGYFSSVADGVEPGSLYLYSLDGDPGRPDPASRLQPLGVHAPSQVVAPRFPWQEDRWRGIPLPDYVIYELHVGTFTREGTFEAVIPHLARLADLGVTAIELMPVAQFPGERNWGYDCVLPFAVQSSYGGPEGLKLLVDACHGRGLAVVLDVVYNHLGPEGNYLAELGPYFTERYKTPWAWPSTSTGRGATRSAATSSRTPSPGSPSTASTPCGWMRSTPSPTTPSVPSWPTSVRRSTRRPRC